MSMSETGRLLSIKQLIRAAGLPGYLLLFHNILIFFVKRRRSIDEYASIDTSAFFQFGFTFIVFGLIFYNLVFKSTITSKILLIKPNVFLLLYVVVCLFSALWSLDIILSFYRAFETLIFLILISWTVYNLSVRLDVQNIIEWVVFWGVWCIFWSIASNVKIFGFSYLQSPFFAARLEYPVVVFFALLLSKRKLFKYTILLFTFLSFSNKIYLGFVLGLIGFLFGNSKSKFVIFTFTILLFSILLFIDVETLLKSTVFIGREEISMENTSGRDKIWQIAWDSFLERPILGRGFVTGESNILFDKNLNAMSSHNFLFSGLLGTGIIGTFFLLCYYFSIFIIGLNKYWPKSNLKVAVIGTLIMSLVVSLSSPGLGGRVYGSWISVVFIISIITALNYKIKYKNKLYS